MYKRTISARSGGRQPAVAWGIAWPARLRTYPDTVVGRVTRSRGREPAVFVGNARARMTTPGFTQLRRTRTKSGGREPAVCRADALAQPLTRLFGRLSSVRWRTPLQSRCRNHGGLTPLRSWFHAVARRRNCDFCDAQTYMHRSGGCDSAVRLRIAWPARLRTYSDTVVGRVTRSSGCQSAVCRADVLAQALPQLLGTLPTGVLAKRLQSRCRNHGGLTPRRSCSGEDAFVQRKSRFFTGERTPYTGAADVSPPCDR